MYSRATVRFGLISTSLILCPLQASTAAAAPKWEMFGKTYNSVAFLDRSSISAGNFKRVRTIRVNGQRTKDSWATVREDMSLDCARRSMGSSDIVGKNADGSVVRWPANKLRQAIPQTGMWANLFAAICNGRHGPKVADPELWTRLNFKPAN
jgi:hypothetical protein